MRPLNALSLLVACLPLALADVKFTVPAASASVAGGTAFTVTWTDSGSAPSISDLTSYQLFLESGSNTAPQQLYALSTTGLFSAGNTITVTVPVTTGGTGTNAYFLKMISVATAGGTVTNYSNRFTLTGMTGTFSQTVTTGLLTVSGTTGPDTVNNVVTAGAAAGTIAVGDGLWGTPYTLQTGLTKYAPMQPVPPTAITATNTSPLWPTSSVVLASTYLPIPSVLTTLTQPQTFSVASHANTAAAASQPTDDMQRFLNRWKD
ncbi:hypothetical protein L207DRAFT_554394 [Hyaloscypha variabilis F]|uniref:Uncharacterized protein n=1 Tax=Hyaloscypha variabilis (strain UAMH 11265 / GT02V1 / F) TaxID=1149755 RepID=A0A2J6RQF7_HYAVF|nr:hypothetical protein L207DRAFT_554394 [Hyaloscypha variabilis F]